MPRVSRCDKMTDKQARFVDEYLIDLNATQAAIRAGYSKRTAGWIGGQLLEKTHIAEAIGARKAKLSEDCGITQRRIVEEMARLAFFDARKMFDSRGLPIPINQLSDDVAACINGLDVVSIGNNDHGVGEVLKFKIPDKNKALENLARILGYFDKDNKQKQQALFDPRAFFADLLRKQDGSGDQPA